MAKTADGDSLILRNVRIRYFDVRRKEETQPFVRLHLSADLSDNVRAAMGWSLGDGITNGTFADRLVGSYLILTPNEKALKDREIQIDISDVSDFKFSSWTEENSSRLITELQFIVRSQQEFVEAELGQYWRAVGDTDAQAKIFYTRQPVQQALVGEEVEA